MIKTFQQGQPSVSDDPYAPRPVIKRLMETLGTKDRNTLRTAYMRECGIDLAGKAKTTKCARGAADYAFGNAYDWLMKSDDEKKYDEALEDQLAKDRLKKRLYNTRMPNGKLLGDMTAPEIIAMADDYAKLGKKLRDKFGDKVTLRKSGLLLEL